MKKKLMSLVLAMTMILSALPAAAAVNADNAGTDFYTQVENFLLNAGVEYDISKYDNVILGGEIPAYYMEDDAGTLQTSSIHYYPILAGDLVIGLLQAYTDKSGNQVFYYSEAYADTINEFLQENALMAILGDGKSLAVVSNNKVKNLTETEHATNLLSKCGEASSLAPVSGLYNLNIDTYHQQSRASDHHMIDVPLKKQHAYWACWAACVASFGQYCEWTPIYTSEQVADEYGWHDYATMARAKSALKKLYNVSPSLYTSSLRTNKLIQYISNNKPLAAGFWKAEESDTDNVGHMVIIRGYSSNSSSFNISIMNPSTGNYALVNVSTDIPITIPLNGQLWELGAYLVNE